MGDSTPDVKPFGKLTSKYLTPCRTFGLKRKSTPKSDIEKKVKSENDPSILKGKTVNESPISRKVTIPRPCLTPINCITDKPTSQLTPIKFGNNSSKQLESKKNACQLTPVASRNILTSKLKTEALECHRTPMRSSKFPTPLELGNNTLDTELATQIMRINEKCNRLEKLKHEQVYTKKHNMLELQKTTEKWTIGFKEVALALHSALQARGRSCTVLDILEEHSIPPERVGFNVENLEFD